MNKDFLNNIYIAHQKCPDCPSAERVAGFFIELLGTLFPPFAKKSFGSIGELSLHLNELKLQLGQVLHKSPNEEAIDWKKVVDEFFDYIPTMHTQLLQDVNAMFSGDPAAKSENEVIRTYPGFYAIAAYRVAHQLHKSGVKIIPRMITEHAHSKTGIDIHPGAKIGNHFCIDHGTGVVIGETAEIGSHVKLYQGVTLGALSVNKEDAERKRHPTIEDNVVVYAGATILGGETVIGHDSTIGGNVWITKSVAPYTKIYYQAKMYNEDSGEIDLVIYKEHI
jgi:serine O-acetyltransferase